MDDIVLSQAEVAEMLKVSRSTIRRLWIRQEFPAPCKIGFVNRWRVSDVEQWLADHETSRTYDKEPVL